MKVLLGTTGIKVDKNGFGALPVQRVSFNEAIKLLGMAFDGGIEFFDTARFYTDSEEKLGAAFKEKRHQIVIASKTMAKTVADFWKDLENSLKNLGTDYIDVYQFHNPNYCPKPGDVTGLYDAMLEAKKKGMILHIGISNHGLSVANEAVESGLYETLQFPFSYLSGSQELDLVQKCQKLSVGFIAMKSLAGGLITNSAAAFAFAQKFDNVLPIWGIQKESELNEFLSYKKNRPILDGEIQKYIDADRHDLAGEFCRGCGYCMPCPVNIEICNCARMSLLIRRSPSNLQLTEAVQAKMGLIENCLQCGECSAKCPYGLDAPNLLKRNLEDYKNILSGSTFV